MPKLSDHGPWSLKLKISEVLLHDRDLVICPHCKSFQSEKKTLEM